MDNEEVFDLELIVFNDATKDENVTNMNAVDLSLRLMMGRMRTVYLHRFVMDLLVIINCSPCSFHFNLLSMVIHSMFTRLFFYFFTILENFTIHISDYYRVS